MGATRDVPAGRAGEPAVTVVVAGPDGLDLAVQSLGTQSIDSLEVVLLPHPGAHGLAETAAQRLRAGGLSATVAPPAANLGAARNAALGEARGRYVTFLDGTAELPAKALEMLVEAADTSGADVAAGRVERVDTGTGRPRVLNSALYREPRRLTGVRELPELLAERALAGKLWRRESLARHDVRFLQPSGDTGDAPDAPAIAAEWERPFVAKALLAARGIVLLDRTVHRGADRPADPAETLAALPARVAALRAVDTLLAPAGLRELRAEKDVIVLRDEIAELTGILTGAPRESLRGRTGPLTEFGRYLGGLDVTAGDRCAPMDRVRVFYLLRGDLEGLRGTRDVGTRRNLVASDLTERDGRVFWSGSELGEPGAERLLDVTELGLHRAGFGELSLDNTAAEVRLTGSRLSVRGAIVNPFGRIAPGDDLRLTLRVRDRIRRESIDTPVHDVVVDGSRLRYRAEVDLERAVRKVTDRSTAWNVSVEVRWKGRSSRSPVTVRDIDLPEGPVRLRPGLHGARLRTRTAAVEPYETVRGNLALRPATTPGADRSVAPPAWDWFRGREITPLAAAPEEYAVAVVVAAYNVADYLPDCLASIAAQSLWPRTQLICVNDGSADDTGEILDAFAAEHPNVTVVHQANAGAGAARNATFGMIRAPYVTFTDADDVLAENALADLYEAATRDGADVVVGDLVTFPAPRPYGPWKRHFGLGGVTVSGLDELPDLIFSASAANKLFAATCVQDRALRFGEGVHFDDAWFALPAMIEANTITLLDRPVYFYRGREDGTSIMDSLWRRPRNVDDHLHLNNHLLRLAAERPRLRQVVARYAARTYANFLTTATDLLPEHRIRELFPDIREHYAGIDDATLLEYVKAPAALLKHYAAKTGDVELYLDTEHEPHTPPRLYVDEAGLYRAPNGAGDCRLLRVRPWVAMERISGEGDAIVVEGVLTTPGIDLTDRLDNRLELVVASERGELSAPVRQVYRRDAYHERGERDLHAGWECRLDGRELTRLRGRTGRMALRVYDADDPSRSHDVPVVARLAAHRFRGLQRVAGRRFWFVLGAGDRVVVQPLGRSPLRLVRHLVTRELLRVRRRTPGWKVRLAYWAAFPFLHHRDIWIVGDRSDTAQDNGFHLFRWIRENRPRRRAYYVIDAGAPDRAKVAPLGNVLIRGSLKHRLYLLHATRLIGSYDLESYLIPTGLNKVRYLHTFGDLIRYKRVFLQHGVIYNDVSKGMSRLITGFDMFVTSAEDERRFIAEEFGYGERAMPLGLTRFDALEPVRTGPPTILVMPTWRSDIVVPSYNRAQRPVIPFAESEYYRFFQRLLTDDRLLEGVRAAGVRVEFYPHYEIQPQAHRFTVDGETVRIADPAERDVQTALRECSLLVTDYSSVFFDVAYQGTPVIYTPFDEADFFSRHYRRGYMDITRDGFGPVSRTVDEAVDAIMHAVKREFTVESPYRQRVADFFSHHDGRNRERVYKAIESL